jgi:DNA-binding Lrp family transcriptional regulator
LRNIGLGIAVNLLKQNASQRLQDLARIGRRRRCATRLRRLQRDGIIRPWTIDADPNALGLDVLAPAFSYAF